MSLINEALRKAKSAQVSGAAAGTSAGPAVHGEEGGTGSRKAPIITLPFVIVLAVMLAGIMLWAWYRAGRVELLLVRANTREASVSFPLQTTATTPAKPAPSPVAASQAAPIAAAVQTANSVATNALAAVQPAVPQAPTYRLEGIFYRPKRPAAVINGQTVYVGSRLEDARVVAIDNESATIVTSTGQTNVLVLAY